MKSLFRLLIVGAIIFALGNVSSSAIPAEISFSKQIDIELTPVISMHIEKPACSEIMLPYAVDNIQAEDYRALIIPHNKGPSR